MNNGDTHQTEYEFTLPSGYLEKKGEEVKIHRHGLMRIANAGDEIHPHKDPRVQSNDRYLTVIVLARVITKLGTLKSIDTDIIETLPVKDVDHLMALYNRINHDINSAIDATCPQCAHHFRVEVPESGGL